MKQRRLRSGKKQAYTRYGGAQGTTHSESLGFSFASFIQETWKGQIGVQIKGSTNNKPQ